MATPDKTAVARWASALTLGQPVPIADNLDVTKFFSKAPLRIHYAAVFNGATATQIHHISPFNWICCLQPEKLAGITTGAALVALVITHLTDQLKAAAPPPDIALSSGLESMGVEAAELPLADGAPE